MISWLDASGATKFGTELAEFFIRRIPLADVTSKNKTSMANKRAALNEMFRQIDKFKIEHRMNFYKKAKLGNAFKWMLLEAGYNSEIIDDLTKEILLKL
ncbi:MAG TPA: hypothetical protein VK974_09005 [Methylophilaceae bacterium]|nr:hypothetical protein [Methylophilaceae bacterium]